MHRSGHATFSRELRLTALGMRILAFVPPCAANCPVPRFGLLELRTGRENPRYEAVTSAFLFLCQPLG